MKKTKRRLFNKKKRKWPSSMTKPSKKRPRQFNKRWFNKLPNKSKTSLKRNKIKKSTRSLKRKTPLNLISKKNSTGKNCNSSKIPRPNMKKNINNKKLSKEGYWSTNYKRMRMKLDRPLIKDMNRK